MKGVRSSSDTSLAITITTSVIAIIIAIIGVLFVLYWFGLFKRLPKVPKITLRMPSAMSSYDQQEDDEIANDHMTSNERSIANNNISNGTTNNLV